MDIAGGHGVAGGGVAHRDAEGLVLGGDGAGIARRAQSPTLPAPLASPRGTRHHETSTALSSMAASCAPANA